MWQRPEAQSSHLIPARGNDCRRRATPPFVTLVRCNQMSLMKPVSSDDFLKWAALVGITNDPVYPDSGVLRLLPVGEHSRFWVNPSDPVQWPHFVDSILSDLGSEGRLNESIQRIMLQGAGIQPVWSGAIRVSSDELDAVVTVCFAYLSFGWCVHDDLLILPDHCQQLVRTDHHGVIHVECRSEERVRTLVAGMAADGYDLPKDPPDWTFRRPAWMDEGNSP